MPTIRCQGRGSAVASGLRPAPRPQPGCGRRRARAAQPAGSRSTSGPARQALQAGGPLRAAQARGDRVLARREVAERQRSRPPRGRHCRSDGAPASTGSGRSSVRPPLSTSSRSPSRRARQSRPWTCRGAPISAARASITASASAGCGPTMHGTPGFRMPAFSNAICASCSPKKALVIERDRRQRGQPRPRDHVGRIEPAAEPGLDQQSVGRAAGEREERRGRGDLELGDRQADD